MIRIHRTQPPPAALASRKVENAKTKIRNIVEEEDRKPLSEEFPSHWRDDDVRQVLWEMQHGKCCYCERKRDLKREADIEHFRPKADVTEAHGDHRGYWWLAYKWENLFFACKYCNQDHKKNFFPIPDEDKRAQAPDDDLEAEDASLIDPSRENPEDHLVYTVNEDKQRNETSCIVWVHARMDSRKGQETSRVTGLNREELIVDRASIFQDLDTLETIVRAGRHFGNAMIVDDAKTKIREATSSKKRYTGFRRDFFRQRGLEEYVADD